MIGSRNVLPEAVEFTRAGQYPTSHRHLPRCKRALRSPTHNDETVMPAAPYFPRRLILAGAAISGILLALAVHVLGQQFGLDLGGLWHPNDARVLVPATAALAWWLIATVGFAGGYFTATLMHHAVSGHISRRMRQFLVGIGVLVLAAAGQAAAAPSSVPTIAGVLAGLTALCLGAAMAFCGAHFALRKA